jgi:hypothetical protein
VSASDQLGVELRQTIDLDLDHLSDGAVDVRQSAAVRQDHLDAGPGAIDGLADPRRQVHLYLRQIRQARVDELS